MIHNSSIPLRELGGQQNLNMVNFSVYFDSFHFIQEQYVKYVQS